MAKTSTSKILVAVYGSLKKGFHNDHYIASSDTFVGDGTVKGFDMFSLGGYPMIVPGNGQISVEVYEVSETTFNTLDRLEGFPHFYDRKRVDVRLNDGSATKTWIYFGRPEQVQGSALVADGIWRDPFKSAEPST